MRHRPSHVTKHLYSRPKLQTYSRQIWTLYNWMWTKIPFHFLLFMSLTRSRPKPSKPAEISNIYIYINPSHSSWKTQNIKIVLISNLACQCFLALCCCLAKIRRLTGHQETNNETKETQNWAENLNDENLDKKRAVCCITNSCSGTSNTNTKAANQIGTSHSQTSPEKRVTSVKILLCEDGSTRHGSELRRKNNSHNETINSNNFAENNTDQIFGGNSRCFDASSKDAWTSDKNTPAENNISDSRTINNYSNINNSLTYQAAPITLRPMQSAIPVTAQA